MGTHLLASLGSKGKNGNSLACLELHKVDIEQEYLGCELVRDRKTRTGHLVQAGYAERVLRAFDMWESHPVATPLDATTRLSKLDCPSAVDPHVHRKYRSIVGCISYLVNMTRPDLAFSYSQLSKFLQHPGDVHCICTRNRQSRHLLP